jgi:hypothetical protein
MAGTDPFLPYLPSSQTPTQQKATSIQTLEQILYGGMQSYIADYLRQDGNAKLLVNVLQSRRQNVWTNRDCGQTRYDTNVFNGGATIYEYGFYIDVNNNEVLIFQCGNELFSYDFTSMTGTVFTLPLLVGGESGLPLSAPCIRQFQPFVATTSSITIICNKGIQPFRINNDGTVNATVLNPPTYSSSGAVGAAYINFQYDAPPPPTYLTVATLGSTETLTQSGYVGGTVNITVGGTVTTGDQLSVVVQFPTLTNGYEVVTYMVMSGDTLTSIATGIAAAINADTNLNGTGYSIVTATSTGPVVTVTYAVPLPPTYAQKESPIGSGFTSAFGPNINGFTQCEIIFSSQPAAGSEGLIIVTSTIIPTGSETVTYTVVTNDTPANAATQLIALINVDPIVRGAGVTAATIAQEYLDFTNVGDGVATVTVMGNPANNNIINVGDIITFTITWPPLNYGSTVVTPGMETITYVVSAVDTLDSIAHALVNLINSDSVLNMNFVISATYTGLDTFQVQYNPPSSLLAGQQMWGATYAPLVPASQSPSSITIPEQIYSQPKFCEPFLNRMAYAGFSDPNNPAVYQDVIITNAGTYNECSISPTLLDTDGTVIQVPPILGSITALKAVQLNNQGNTEALVIGCTRGVVVVSGTGALSFSSAVLTQEFGIPSNRALAQIGNDVIFMASDGIRAFSALVINANLVPSSITYGLQDVVNTWDQEWLQNAFVVRHRITRDIQFWIPQLGNTAEGGGSGEAEFIRESVISSNGICGLGMVLNYGNSTPGVTAIPQLTFSISLRMGLQIPCAIEFQDPNNSNTWTMFGGGYSANSQGGAIFEHYSGNLNDGIPLPFFATFSYAGLGNPATGFSVRKISIITEGGGGQNYYASCSFLTTMGNGTTLKQTNSQGPTNLTTGEVLETQLGSWVLGESAFPGTFTQFLEFIPTGEGRFMELQVSGFGADNFIDLIGAHYMLSGGGTRR